MRHFITDPRAPLFPEDLDKLAAGLVHCLSIGDVTVAGYRQRDSWRVLPGQRIGYGVSVFTDAPVHSLPRNHAAYSLGIPERGLEWVDNGPLTEEERLAMLQHHDDAERLLKVEHVRLVREGRRIDWWGTAHRYEQELAVI